MSEPVGVLSRRGHSMGTRSFEVGDDVGAKESAEGRPAGPGGGNGSFRVVMQPATTNDAYVTAAVTLENLEQRHISRALGSAPRRGEAVEVVTTTVKTTIETACAT